jgi:hypothetical protein
VLSFVIDLRRTAFWGLLQAGRRIKRAKSVLAKVAVALSPSSSEVSMMCFDFENEIISEVRRFANFAG